MLQLWQISALALVAGMLSPATGVGMRVLLPHLVQEDALPRANALASTSLQFAFLVGPVLAGILVTHVGGAYAFAAPDAAVSGSGRVFLGTVSPDRSFAVAAADRTLHARAGFWEKSDQGMLLVSDFELARGLHCRIGLVGELG